ncbi:hypothetical protein [Curtobacterium sp. MCBD17_040]|nr:hypothetical protein [Curtobacterium sp. MCBD17_040]WIB65889.1 hypothetical protein DEI94_17390 [Curtobacterium sp. MCBD17_040]
MTFLNPFGQPQQPGQLGIDFDGDLEIGLGGGFAVDVETGDLEYDGFDI